MVEKMEKNERKLRKQLRIYMKKVQELAGRGRQHRVHGGRVPLVPDLSVLTFLSKGDRCPHGTCFL